LPGTFPHIGVASTTGRAASAQFYIHRFAFTSIPRPPSISPPSAPPASPNSTRPTSPSASSSRTSLWPRPAAPLITTPENVTEDSHGSCGAI
jgi:hypothetical protein